MKFDDFVSKGHGCSLISAVYNILCVICLNTKIGCWDLKRGSQPFQWLLKKGQKKTENADILGEKKCKKS